MIKFQIPSFILVFCFGAAALASPTGDEFINLGQRINQTNSLTANQISQLQTILSNARDVLNHGTSHHGFTCIQGTVYGPNGFEKWTGDSQSCSNPKKVKVTQNYVCITGTLYGANGLEKWSGSSDACGDRNKINIGIDYACVTGTVYGPNGFEKWTGDSNYCGKVTMD